MSKKTPLLIGVAITLLSSIGIGCIPVISTTTTSTSTQTTTGSITGFGSVIVKGVHFNTAGAEIKINDVDSSYTDLATGMVVNIKGDGLNQDGEEDYTHGDDDDGVADEEDNALEIEANNELEGEVLSTTIASGSDTGTIDVMGQTVHVSADTLFESDVSGITSVDQVSSGHIVEVYGFSDGNGNIFATRVELSASDLATYLLANPDSNGDEVKGNISNINKSNKTFSLGSLIVDYSTAEIDANGDEFVDGDDSGLADGLLVEVKSVSSIQSGTLIATEVELEDEGEHGYQGNTSENYDLEGIITSGYNGSTFKINGVTVVVTGNTIFETADSSALIAGAEIEVEGQFNAVGELIAASIDFEAEADQELTGSVSAVTVNAGTVNVGSIELNGNTILIDNETLMHDEAGASPIKLFNLTFISAGNTVDVRTYTSATGDLVAVELERKAI